MHVSRLALALLPVIFLAPAPPATAQALTDAGTIDRAVEEFTGRKTGESGGALNPVDRRLRLAACPVPLAAAWHGEAGRSVVVRCPAGAGWRVFVPVGMAAAASTVPVVARGEAVAIVIAGRGFTLSRKGEALDAGSIGQWIRVRPMGGGKSQPGEPLRMQVVKPGTVGMDLP